MAPADDQDRSTRIAPRGVGPGTRLNGIFEIDALIANGGMGEVYRGHNIQTLDPVAIKMILPEFSANADGVALFRREASALHNLQHDAIVRYYVFSVDPDIGRAYLAMEYVEGPSLSDVMERGPLDADDAEILLGRMADALQAAHRGGVVHRDLSPDNIVLPGGDVRRAKLIDFGIARLQKQGEQTIIGSNFAGKFNYASPEQLGIAGGEVTSKSDIYSLGLVIAGALLGRPLDMGGTQFEIIEKRRRLPDLTAMPPRLRPLIEAMLQPRPEDRPSDLSLAPPAATRSLPESPFASPSDPPVQPTLPPLRSRFTEPPPAPPARRKMWPFAVAALLVVGGGVAAFTLLRQPPAPPPAEQAAPPATAEAPPVTETPAATAPAPQAAKPALPPPEAASVEPAGQPPQEAAIPASPPPAAPVTDGPKLPSVDEILASLGEDKGGAQPAPPATKPAEAAPEPAPPASAPPEATAALSPDTLSAAAVADLLRGFQGGPCVAAQVAALTPDSLTLDGLAEDTVPFRPLSAAIAGRFGIAPRINVELVTHPQCGAVDLVAAFAGRGGSSPAIHIERTRIGADQPLSGRIDGIAGGRLDLLLVTNDGQVVNLNGAMKPGPGGASFSTVLTPDAASVDQPQLLLAVTAPAQLASLADFRGATDGAAFLSGLGEEIAASGGSVGAGVFRLGK